MNKLVIIVSFVIILLPSITSATEWESIGPEGGNFCGIASDPLNANNAIAVSSKYFMSLTQQVYRTLDGGQSWTVIGEIPVSKIYNLSAYDASRLYALSFDGCHSSVDGGASWNYSEFPGGSYNRGFVCADPSDPDKVHVAVEEYLSGSNHLIYFSSTSGGQDWVPTLVSEFDEIPQCIHVSASDPDIIYICGYNKIGGFDRLCLFQSLDGGSSWANISNAVDIADKIHLYSVAVDPADHNKVYAVGENFYRSTDSGISWSKVSSHNFKGKSIGIDPIDSSRIYMAGGQNVFVSSDYGLTFIAHNCLVGEGSHVEISEADPSKIYVSASHGGLFKSTDWGASWSATHTGITETAGAWRLPIDPQPLLADVQEVSESTGGVINFSLNASLDNAGRNYILLGSISGTSPGFPLPNSNKTLPLNWDLFTDIVVAWLNSTMFIDFMGALDMEGQATATWDTLGPLPAGSAGLIVDFAFALRGPWNFVSNPIAIEIVP